MKCSENNILNIIGMLAVNLGTLFYLMQMDFQHKNIKQTNQKKQKRLS